MICKPLIAHLNWFLEGGWLCYCYVIALKLLFASFQASLLWFENEFVDVRVNFTKQLFVGVWVSNVAIKALLVFGKVLLRV